MFTDPPPSVHLEEFERMLETTANEVLSVQQDRRLSQLPPEDDDDALVVATIAFTGEHARGKLSLICLQRFTEALEPDGLEASAEERACAVLAEMANMVLGRLKNRLLTRGVEIAIATPEAGVARNMRPTDDAFSSCQQVALASGRIFMQLDATFDEPFEFKDEVPLSSLFGLDDHTVFFEG